MFDLTEREEFLLMESFRAGEKEAFQTIYNSTIRLLLFYVKQHVKDEQIAEDIVGETYYKLYQTRGTKKSINHIKRWLYKVCYHASVDHLRLKIKVMEHKSEVSYGAEDCFMESALETERVRIVLMEAIINEIEQLPRQRRQVMKMYFFEDKSTQEIAEILNLNAQTVLNHKAKAIETLKKKNLRKIASNGEVVKLW